MIFVRARFRKCQKKPLSDTRSDNYTESTLLQFSQGTNTNSPDLMTRIMLVQVEGLKYVSLNTTMWQGTRHSCYGLHYNTGRAWFSPKLFTWIDFKYSNKTTWSLSSWCHIDFDRLLINNIAGKIITCKIRWRIMHNVTKIKSVICSLLKFLC